jgi:Protein of unknown function (DUF2956).
MKKGLPSKFAKMGFAKGWREYKKSKKSKSSGDDMARKRRRSRAAPARRRYSRRRSRNTKKIFGIPKNWILLGAGGIGIYYLFLNKNGATDGGFW